MTNARRIPFSFPARQRGAALAVVLILLVVMILIGLASLRGTLMEERMTSNMRDRSLAFQSAEAALRMGESVAQGKPSVPTTPGSCAVGLCSKPNPTAAPVWQNTTVWAAAPSIPIPSDAPGMPPAKYIVELLADNVPPAGSCTTSGDVSETSCSGKESRYRITARSSMNNRAEVTLQSTYSVP